MPYYGHPDDPRAPEGPVEFLDSDILAMSDSDLFRQVLASESPYGRPRVHSAEEWERFAIHACVRLRELVRDIEDDAAERKGQK